MIKYVEEFCPVDRYRCLMPVEYELIENSTKRKVYKKTRCNCYNVKDGRCDKEMECSHYIAAEDIIEE